MTDWWTTTFPTGRQTVVIDDASGERVAIAYATKGSGTPLFLLHGIGSWSYSWNHCIDALAEHYQVFCVDAKGNGFSEPTFRPEVPGHQVIELERIMEALVDQPAIAIAESLGALTALGVAVQRPELFHRLVLVNVPIFPKRLPSAGMRLLANLPLEVVRLVDSARLARPVAPLVREFVRVARREVVHDPTNVTDDELYWLTYPYIEFRGTLTRFATDLQQAAQEIEKCLSGEPNLISSIQERLDKVTCPTLILWGESDRWFPPEDGQQLHARLPQAQFRILPNCGHNAAGCSPQALVKAVLEFLQEVDAQVPHSASR